MSKLAKELAKRPHIGTQDLSYAKILSLKYEEFIALWGWRDDAMSLGIDGSRVTSQGREFFQNNHGKRRKNR